ncbi:MAG: fumarylacetoacetate hydrolase family protein [Flavisolibacter sp.]|nr:fumarylacetoacetate hydrolase family protein [Flavisolibacter sp.]
MKLYKTKQGIAIENESGIYVLQNENWESFVNDDNLYQKLQEKIKELSPTKDGLQDVLAPIGSSQELWACGVTYLRSKIGRQEESKDAGGGDFYGRVYEADRPEVFFKATPQRVVGTNEKVRIRKDSTWDVPEPELTLVVSSSGKIVGYTAGNDMSSRSIEGENPLYLPQAKTYDKCAAVGPCILVAQGPLPQETTISLEIKREGSTAFQGSVALSQMKRKPEELVSYVYRECSFPGGCLIMTGTGIVPESNFTLRSGDEILISIEGIGTLRNVVE